MNKPRRTTISVFAAVLFALVALPATASANVANGPASMTFPDRLVGTQSDPQTETVVVFCTAPNGVNPALCQAGFDDTFTPNPVFTGANPGDFAQTNNCGAAKSSVPGVNPGVNSCQFFITFKPTAQGTRTATLTLGTNLTGAPPAPVSLSGVGIITPPTPTPAATGQRAAALAKCKNKKSKKARKKCKKKANRLPV
ncbi:MAG: hypothetical protein ACXWED_06360 [Solirubrobacterales bacterium]